MHLLQVTQSKNTRHHFENHAAHMWVGMSLHVTWVALQSYLEELRVESYENNRTTEYASTYNLPEEHSAGL